MHTGPILVGDFVRLSSGDIGSVTGDLGLGPFGITYTVQLTGGNIITISGGDITFIRHLTESIPSAGVLGSPLPTDPMPVPAGDLPSIPRTPIDDLGPTITPINIQAQSPTGGFMAPLLFPVLVRPAGALVLKAAVSLTRASRRMGAAGSAFSGSASLPGLGGGSIGILNTILAGFGVTQVMDILGIDFFGQDRQDADQLGLLVEELLQSGYIRTPGDRKDGSAAGDSWLHWNMDDDDARPFLTGEYINRNFVAAVKKNLQTPRYTGRPRPRGRSRRGG